MNFITLIFTSLLMLNINSVIASHKVIWDDNLFERNKDFICNKISEQSYESMIYMDEILKRMIQNKWFKKYLLIDQSMNPIKQILIDYMEFGVLDDYYIRYNFKNEPEETFYKNVPQYEKNLRKSLYNLGYKNNMPLREYAQKYLDLYSDLKDSLKVKPSINTDNIEDKCKTMIQPKKKQNNSCWFM